MSKIYTRSGDDGTTGLVDGGRVAKSDPRLEIYGEIDELNSRLGLIPTALDDQDLNQFVKNMQNWSFSLSSHLACEKDKRATFKLPPLKVDEWVQFLEQKMDAWDRKLPELKNFILPGGALAAAHLHLSRTQARKIERLLVGFCERESDDHAFLSQTIIFFNRASDAFFVAARLANLNQGETEILWRGEV